MAINDSLSFPQRFQRFLYSPGNIAGCLLAMGGLGLFFGGVIQAYWWAIVPGLYGVGALAWPRDPYASVERYHPRFEFKFTGDKG